VYINTSDYACMVTAVCHKLKCSCKMPTDSTFTLEFCKNGPLATVNNKT